MNRYGKMVLVIGLIIGTPVSALADLALLPSNTFFALKGMITLESGDGSVTCKVLIDGNTAAAGSSKRDAGTLSSGIMFGSCKHTPKFAGFPWTVRLNSKNGGLMSGFGYIFEGYPCSYNVPFTVSKRGAWTFNGTQAGCNVSGTLKTIPPITIGK